jgi:ATP-dependent DNA helicase RecG
VSETKLTERQQKMLNLIKESPTITGKQMSETLSVSQRTIERDLSALQKHVESSNKEFARFKMIK